MKNKIFLLFLIVLSWSCSSPQLVDIPEIWCEHGAIQNGQIGIAIHSHIIVRYMQGCELNVECCFYDKNGQPIDGCYMTGNTVPDYIETTYNDFCLFMPYSKLPVKKDVLYYYDLIIKTTDNNEKIGGSYYNEFTTNRDDKNASFDSITVKPNVTLNGNKGLCLQGNLLITGNPNETFEFCVSIYDKDKNLLKGIDSDYSSLEGNFFAHNDYKLDDFGVLSDIATCFIPYSALPTMFNSDPYYYVITIRVENDNSQTVFQTDYLNFEHNRWCPSASIESSWVEHDVYSDGIYGANIHTKLIINNLKGIETDVALVLCDENHVFLNSLLSEYSSDEGSAMVNMTVNPQDDNGRYDDFELFIPYETVKAPSSGEKYKYFICIRDEHNKNYDSNWYDLGWSNSKQQEGLPKIEWLSSSAAQTTDDYTVIAGIKSKSKISNVSLTVNGQSYRGFKNVKNDNYDMRVEQKVKLTDGNNNIQISVTNSLGTSKHSLKIICKTNDVITTNSKRLALVIGNSDYREEKLINPSNDATDVSAKLKDLGFDVITLLDGTKRDMEDKIREFGEEARNYEVALFYYAGHGIQSGGINYLIPVDVVLKSQTDVEYDCTNANRVLAMMENANCKTNIVVLDACRNNPFERGWSRGTGQSGLSFMDAPAGSIVAYSTSPGQVAQDGTGRNSPYTDAFLKALNQENLSIHEFFPYVSRIVQQNTGKSQVPWINSSYSGQFYFNTDK